MFHVYYFIARSLVILFLIFLLIVDNSCARWTMDFQCERVMLMLQRLKNKTISLKPSPAHIMIIIITIEMVL